MSRQEKIAGVTLAALLFGVLAYFVVDWLWFSGARKLDADIQKAGDELALLKVENEAGNLAERRLAAILASLYGPEQRAREGVRVRLVNLVQRSGLDRLDVHAPAVSKWTGYKKSRGRSDEKELSRVVTATGPLPRVVDLLYLLQADEHLHRVDEISFTPSLKRGTVDVRFKYATLILTPPGAKKPSDATPATSRAAPSPPPAPGPKVDLDTPGRRFYDVIPMRDVFRPFIKRPPRVALPPVAAKGTPGVSFPPPLPPPPEDPEQRLRVVGLPCWNGQHLIHVQDARTRTVHKYKVGQRLPRGQIVMVDYRPMRMPGSPPVVSPSRVILEVGGDYWAIELGQTLGDRRRLRGGELPESLKKTPASLPVSGTMSRAGESGLD